MHDSIYLTLKIEQVSDYQELEETKPHKKGATRQNLVDNGKIY